MEYFSDFDNPQTQGRGVTPVNDCSHVYSDGTNVTAIFTEIEDKYRILDMLAITALETGVRILVAEVMTTHFHSMVSGRDQNRERFKNSTKRKLLNWISRKGLKTCVKGELRLSNDPIKDEDELKGKIMYVYRNSLCAGIMLVPWKYEGGPGDIYFIDHAEESLKGKPVSGLSVNKRRQLFHTLKELPVGWRYDEKGHRLLPHSYMDWQRVERLFRTLRAFVAFMAQKKDLEVKYDMECAAGAIEKASEKDLRKEVRLLCRQMYGFDSYFDFKSSGEFDKITRAHQEGKPVPQGMHTEEYNEGSVFTAKVQMNYGKSHLDYCDGLRTIGYSEGEIKNMCKQEGIKYNPPMFQVGSTPKAKNPVKHNQPNPVRPNTITRIWN